MLAIALALIGPQGVDAAAPEGADVEAVVAALEDVSDGLPRRMAAAGVPGLAVALVDREGIVWSECFGSTAKEDGAPIGEETLFSVQSISKAVTATAVMLAVHDGLLDLDAPITEYAPGFKVQSRFGERPEASITLRHLLSHRAGLTHEAPVSNNHAPEAASFAAHVESISRTWLRYPVGQRYAYSNLGVDLAGWILEQAIKRPFADAMQERLLAPIGMESATFDWSAIRAAEDRALGHHPRFRRVPLEFWFLPSGGLYASLRDMAAFVRFHLDGGRMDGEALLDPELLAQMRREPFPGAAQSYGLGIDRMPVRGFVVFNHNGGGFGFQSHAGFCVELALGLVILANDGASSLVWDLRDEMWAGIVERSGVPAPAAPPLAPAVHEASPAPASPVAGDYVADDLVLRVNLDGDRATLSIGPGRTAPLAFVSADTARVDMGGTLRTFRFHFDEGGAASWLECVEDGRTADWNGAAGEPPGPGLAAWRAHEGTWDQTLWGEPGGSITIRLERGWLWLDGLRLSEHEPGLFFTSTGEALDLRGETPTYRNIVLRRRTAPPGRE